MVDFSKFKNTSDALKSASKLLKQKMPAKLEKMLSKNLVDDETQEKLAGSLKFNEKLPIKSLEK